VIAQPEVWKGIFREAHGQEERAKDLLLTRLTLKAANDPSFQRELRDDPDAVVRREAKELDIKPSKSLIEAAGKAATAAIPGLEQARVQTLVFTTIEDMRTSFKLTLELSRWLFFAGILLVMVAFVAGLFNASSSSVAVSGGSGALSLLLSAVMNPLDRIRNAAGNLVQIQAAYLAFYKQLTILGGGDVLAREEIIAYAREIREASSGLAKTITGALEGARATPLKTEPDKPPPAGSDGGRARQRTAAKTTAATSGRKRTKGSQQPSPSN
jgi:hypothetical protein